MLINTWDVIVCETKILCTVWVVTCVETASGFAGGT